MLRAARSASDQERLMKTARALHSADAAQGVGEHEGAGLEGALGPGGDLLALKGAAAAQAHPYRPALAIELHRSYERRLARRPSPARACEPQSGPPPRRSLP